MINNITIRDIANNIISDIEAETGQAVPLLAKAVFRVMSWALAGVWVILYKYGTDGFKQRFPQTAGERWLTYLGELVNVIRQVAVAWEGEAEIEATGAMGNIDAGTQFVDSDSGKVYVVINPVAIVPGTLTIELIAFEAGEDSTVVVGTELNIVSPIAGVATIATVSVVAIDGDDLEDLEVYRRRVVDRYRIRPQGGALSDYVLWASGVPNVISVYPYSVLPTLVAIYIEVDNQLGGIPVQAQLDLVEDACNYDPITGEANRKPAGTILAVEAIYLTAFNVRIIGLTPDTPEMRADIEEALIEMIENKEPYIEGISKQRLDNITYAEFVSTIYFILSTYGALFTAVTITEPAGDLVYNYVLGQGEKAELGAIDYV